MKDRNRLKCASNQTLAAIGSIVRNTRRLRQLSQTQLAVRAQLNQKTISALENGSEGVEARTLFRVFDELGLKVEIGAVGSQVSLFSSEDGRSRQLDEELLFGPDREEVLKRLRSVKGRLKKLGITSLALFGSTARGEAGPRSDIDIAYEFDGDPSLFTVGKINDLLQSLFKKKVDLVRLKALKGAVRAEAEKDFIYVI